MKNSLGIGVVSSLILGTVAAADFDGLDYSVHATEGVAGSTTYRIYAVMDSGERLDAVAGDLTNNKTVTTSTSFYQNAFGSYSSAGINPALYSAFPSLVYDSWVTIGFEDQTGNNLNDIGIDWAPFEAGGNLFADNGTWFVTPKDVQGEAVEFENATCETKYGVLVAQLTVMDGGDAGLAALFQGKDASGATWGPTYADITIGELGGIIDDCNDNGIADSCDILNGTSSDDNGNGIPDECEFIDCNDNGVADDEDIANETSTDCDFNGIPDECELDGNDCNENGIHDACEELDDCNENGVPDACEDLQDCNDNGIPDACEDLQDWDDNGVPDACEGLVAYNVDQGTGHAHIDDAIADSDDGDTVWVQADHVNSLSDVEYHDSAIDIWVLVGDADGFSTNMASGARLHGGNDAALDSVRSGTDGTSVVGANNSLSSNFAMVYRGASLDFEAPTVSLGDVIMRMDSELGINGAGTVNGMMSCVEGSTVIADLSIGSEGELVGTVDIYGETSNAGEMRATDDILIGSNMTNDGLVAIHRGVLYVLGDLTNNGTILGDVDGGPGIRGSDEPEFGDGMNVVGDYTAGSDASLFMAHPNWRLSVGGNFDVSINDSSNFDMSLATLNLNGIGTQEVEVMGADLGGIEEALDPSYGCTYPYGNVSVASGSEVRLVNNRDNDCDGELTEVMYVNNLVVNVGATLDTNGYVVYAAEVENLGTIIGDDGVIIIDPPVLGDLDGDGIVGIDDLLIVISSWGSCDGCPADFDDNGEVGIDDLLVVIANWS